MNGFLYHGFFLIFIFSETIVAETIFLGKGDAGGSNDCGSSFNLQSNGTLEINSKGNAPNGYCSVLIQTEDDVSSDCKYPGICARVNAASMDGCKGKVSFSGISAKGRDDKSWGLSCYKKPENPTCTDGNALQIAVLEDLEYASLQDGEKSKYSFNIAVYRKCSEILDDDYRAPDLEEGWRQNYIVGIVVGVCLALMFLIILVIMKFYYKNDVVPRLKSEK